MARIRIIEVEGDAEELAGLDIEKLLGEHATIRADNGHVEGGRNLSGEVPAEIRQYIHRKASQREYELFLRFVGTILGWNSVRAKLSAVGRDGDPRSILVRRLPQHTGAFVIVNPRLGRVSFRLPLNEAARSPLATTVPKGRAYQVRVPLTSEEAFNDALKLAQLAYDGAVRAI